MEPNMLLVHALFCALSATTAVLPADHDPGLSCIRVARAADRLVVHAEFANADFRSATSLDPDGDGRVTATELAGARPMLADLVEREFVVSIDGVPARADLLSATIGNDADVELTFAVPLAPGQTTLRVEFLRRLSRGHRCYAAVLPAGTDVVANGSDERGGPVLADALLHAGATVLVVPDAVGAAGTGFAQARAFFELGIEHILFGFDHLAFLLALLVGVIGRGRSPGERGPVAHLLATITAFTVAHSLTLLGTRLGWFHLPVGLVEAAIAASIVVVATANLFGARAAHRWHLAFGFGLLHGFGFAASIDDLLRGPDILLPLATFNLGVEVGQLAFAVVTVPLLVLATRLPRSARVTTVLSSVIGLAGLFWLGERLLP
jgi:hypothetical protein